MTNGTEHEHNGTEEKPTRLLTLAEEHERFALMCVPADAPSFQRRDMCKAFYAGAAAMFSTMLAIIEKQPDEQLAAALLDNYANELEKFALRVTLENALYASLVRVNKANKGEAQ